MSEMTPRETTNVRHPTIMELVLEIEKRVAKLETPAVVMDEALNGGPTLERPPCDDAPGIRVALERINYRLVLLLDDYWRLARSIDDSIRAEPDNKDEEE